MFAGNFAPAGWMLCDGQLLPISENETLFNLIGTTYGGDGQSTFALPDLRGRLPIHHGNGFVLAETGGSETVTLLESEIPAHSHTLRGSLDDDDSTLPGNNYHGQLTTTYAAAQNLQLMAPQSLSPAGGGQPHNNMMPYLTFNFCIALQGEFPPLP
jgi:microcystin-dependent protein